MARGPTRCQTLWGSICAGPVDASVGRRRPGRARPLASPHAPAFQGMPTVMRAIRSVVDHRADHLATIHQIECVIDTLQRQDLADHLVDADLAGEVAFDIAGQLRAALDAAECRAAPDPAGDQLEWPRADFLPGARHADDDRFAPALV